MKDFNKGEQDCKAGLPALRRGSKEYIKGYAAQYALEQSQSDEGERND
tara:strand:- start:1016 stop:1159 length:144 start_codon:yes stop_codon:yes gene_type:complete